MHLTDLKDPRFYIPLGLVLILAVLSAVVFHPAFQKKMLLEHVGPLVDSLEIDSVHLTPWSLDLNNLTVVYRGGRFQFEEGSVRFCLSSVLLLNLNIETLALKNVRIDLEAFNPPETETPAQTEPFPGVLASLEHGLSYTLQELSVNGAVRLPGQQSLTARIAGEGIRPKASGGITMAVRFNTGNDDDYIDLDGKISLEQLTRGRFATVESTLAIQAAMAALPDTEHVDVNLAVRPAPISQDRQATATKDGEKPQYTPEALQLALLQNDIEGNNRSKLELEGTYNGNTADFGGGYRVTANERLVRPYAGENVIPPSKEVLTGELNLNIANLTGDMTVMSNLLVKDLKEVHANERLPELLRLQNNFRLSLLPGKQLRVEILDTYMSDEGQNPALTSNLPTDLNIPLDDIDSFLQQENTLLEFELPGVPLPWFDVFLPEHEITDGTLTAAFEITTDTNSTIHIKPLKGLEVAGLTVKKEDATLIEGLNLSIVPVATYTGDTLSVSLEKLVVDAGKGTLAAADFNATLPLSEEQPGTVDAHANAHLNLHNLVDFLAIKQTGRQTMPERLSLHFQTALRQQPGSVVVNKLDASLSKDRETRLLNLQLLQPLVMESTEDGGKLGNAAGKLATFTISDIQLGWFSAFMPETILKGKLNRADFTLSADAPGVAGITSARPFEINDVTLTGKDGPLLEDLDISLRPTVRVAAEGTDIAYKDLSVTSNSTSLMTGNGRITLPGAAEQALVADGRLGVDVQALSQQPVLARALQGSVQVPVRLEADYELAQGNTRIDINRLAANLFYGEPEPKVSLRTDSKVRVRTQLGRNQSELGRARGKVTLTVADLTPEPFAEILAANGLAFTEATGKAVLTSDGKSLMLNTIEPFVIRGLEVKTEDTAALHPFTLTADSEAIMQGETLHARLDQFIIAFDKDQGTHAIDGTAGLTLKGAGDGVRLDALNADLTVSLPAMLDQPALLPDHTLAAGELQSTMTMEPDGKIDSTMRIQGLQGKEELPLQVLELKVDGQVDPDGGLAITAPITTNGKSGDSDIQIKATHSVKDGANNDVAIAIDSSVFYLNDILNTLNTIAGQQLSGKSAEKMKVDEDQAADRAATELGQQADETAFWGQTDYNAYVTFNMDRLFYTDYLEIHDIKARAEFAPGRLALREFEAHFHESPLTADGILTFTPGEIPYDLGLQAGVDRFELARFFRELAPGSKPRAEGLFDVKIDAFGQSPNMSQYRNYLFFDMRIQSKDGVFRLLDPDSAVVAGSTGFAGAFGEVVSYAPTGLFGAGAVSRLVNYIKEIEYDKIDMHLVRDESRDVQIRQYVVQSPEVLLTANGGIEYQEGIDILQSPLSLDAQLNMREKGAAILYALDLLESEQDPYGYWKGPAIRFWGAPANSESNLGDIISTAGRGAVLGGIIRPISGLIGNIKHRWIGDDEEPVEYNKGASDS